ncbi:alpha/beta hydrolase [Gordonia terrae]
MRNATSNLRSRPSRRRVLGAALALAFAVGACSAPSSGADDLDRFYQQELTFEPCDAYPSTQTEAELFATAPAAQCARMDVPLDYQDPDGRSAEIAVMRIPARGESQGSLVLNTGGPGGGSTAMAATLATTWADRPATEQFDLVGFDPRGTGASVPAVDCLTDEQLDAGEAPGAVPAAEGRWTAADTRASVERCAEGSGGEDVLSRLGTRDVARDMDVLRAVVGDDRLTYFGQSYGTRLGAVYAEMFPDKVRAMLLDGGIDPSTTYADTRAHTFASMQRAFDAMAADCATRAACPLGTDANRATEVFSGLVRPLVEVPVPSGEGRTLDFNAAVGGVGAGLYDPAAWPAIRTGLTELADGRGNVLQLLSDSFGGRDENGHWSNFTEANHAINCADEDRLSPEDARALRQRIWEVAPFMDPGTGYDGARDGCESWPGEPTLGVPYATDVTGLAETLTISITGDPSTPYEGGVAVADALGGSLLTVEGTQHTVAAAGTNDCVNTAVDHYLVDLTPPAPGARCTL